MSSWKMFFKKKVELITQQLSNNVFVLWIADEPEEKIIEPEDISVKKISVSKIYAQGGKNKQSASSNESSNEPCDNAMQSADADTVISAKRGKLCLWN